MTTARAAFDASEGRQSGLRGAAAGWAWDRLPTLAAALRTARPNVRVGRLVIVTRRDDVEEVLSNPEAFPVRTGVRLGELQARAGIECPPPPFGLSSDEETKHLAASKAVARVLRLQDAGFVAERARAFASARAGAGAVDLGTLLLGASADVANAYFGLDLEADELLELALCCQAMVSYAFGVGGADSVAGRVGGGGAARVSEILRRSIRTQKPRPRPGTVVGRLLQAGESDAGAEAAATLMMMALVAVPTVSGMNAARLLLSRPSAMEAARAAALGDDDVALGRCLSEALRLRYISPGILRSCASEFVVAAGTKRALRARRGDIVLPATLSGMRDGRRVGAEADFHPDRQESDSLIFGFGRHRCAGAAIGGAMMTGMLKPLLRRGVWQTGADRRAVSWFGRYQEHFPVRLG